jgi:hypothetical protein
MTVKLTAEQKARRLFGEPEPDREAEKPPGRVPAGPRSDDLPETDWVRRALRGGSP